MNATRRSLCFGIPLATLFCLASAPALADVTKDQCVEANGKAQDLRRDGKLSSAREQLRTCANPSCPAIVRDDCTKRLDDLERVQPTIIFEAKDGAGNDLIAVKVTADGIPLADRLVGTPLSIDPGEHTFTFEAAGQPALQKKFVIRESEKDRRERITLGATDTATPQAVPASGAQPPTSTQPPETSPGLGTQKILAVVAGGVGVVGLGLGTAFGLMTISKRNDAQSACPNSCSTQDGVTKWSDATSAGNVSTIAFIIGGVGVAGAAVLWFTAPSSSGPRTQVGLGPGVLQLKGTW
jgi:hypothetical protein